MADDRMGAPPLNLRLPMIPFSWPAKNPHVRAEMAKAGYDPETGKRRARRFVLSIMDANQAP